MTTQKTGSEYSQSETSESDEHSVRSFAQADEMSVQKRAKQMVDRIVLMLGGTANLENENENERSGAGRGHVYHSRGEVTLRKRTSYVEHELISRKKTAQKQTAI
ncbi:MAG: hypothetical protein AAGG44_04850 [Planctomycetota bacterium]